MSNQDNLSDLIARAAAWIGSRTILLIGGDARPDQVRRLKAAFPLATIRWHATRERRASPEALLDALSRTSNAVVVIVHGLARHAHTLAVRDRCSRLSLPLLWCRRPSPAQIARAASVSRTSK